ncbi:hypothetical protein [Paracoccus aminovorans]|uniref:hypothetical protein n=1 Tax=Paracoccus aminovorans TaxID=34004 RepID=UPI000785E0C6|nr:hypothetical protein [Paracoccus aminovorans]
MAADPLAAIDIALAEVGIAASALDRLGRALTTLRQSHLDGRLSDLPPCDVPVIEHRREHRMGRAPKIDADPELPAFILARLDRLTYHQIAAEIAAHFPPARHVHPATSTAGRSVIGDCNDARSSPISARPLWVFADQLRINW